MVNDVDPRVALTPVHVTYTTDYDRERVDNKVKLEIKEVGNQKRTFQFPTCRGLHGVSDRLPHAWEFFQTVQDVNFEQHGGVFHTFMAMLMDMAKTEYMKIHNDIADDDDYGIDAFRDSLKAWIALTATSNNRAYLVDYIRLVKKPRNIGVKSFQVLLGNLNNMVEWLPGTDAALDEAGFKRAFTMP